MCCLTGARALCVQWVGVARGSDKRIDIGREIRT